MGLSDIIRRKQDLQWESLLEKFGFHNNTHLEWLALPQVSNAPPAGRPLSDPFRSQFKAPPPPRWTPERDPRIPRTIALAKERFSQRAGDLFDHWSRSDAYDSRGFADALADIRSSVETEVMKPAVCVQRSRRARDSHRYRRTTASRTTRNPERPKTA
jgi:hypothetical protein